MAAQDRLGIVRDKRTHADLVAELYEPVEIGEPVEIKEWVLIEVAGKTVHLSRDDQGNLDSGHMYLRAIGNVLSELGGRKLCGTCKRLAGVEEEDFKPATEELGPTIH